MQLRMHTGNTRKENKANTEYRVNTSTTTKHINVMVMFSSLFVCLFVCLSVSIATLRKHLRPNLHESCREGQQWASEQLIKFWWRSGLPCGYRDCFPDVSLLGDTESGVNRLRCATLQSRARTRGIAIATMTSLRHRPLAYRYMHSPSVSSFKI